MIAEQVQDYNGEYSGICKYCGQIVVFQSLIPGEDANGTATRLCDCKQGRAYDLVRKDEEMEHEHRERAIRDAGGLIEALFGPDAGARIGISLPAMNDKARAHLQALTARIYDEEIEKVVLSADGIRATMTKDSKGNIKIGRRDTQEIVREVIT